MHLTIHDSSGASLVVQFNKNGRMEVLDNPAGVLANAPFLQEQIRVSCLRTGNLMLMVRALRAWSSQWTTTAATANMSL